MLSPQTIIFFMVWKKQHTTAEIQYFSPVNLLATSLQKGNFNQMKKLCSLKNNSTV